MHKYFRIRNLLDKKAYKKARWQKRFMRRRNHIRNQFLLDLLKEENKNADD